MTVCEDRRPQPLPALPDRLVTGSGEAPSRRLWVPVLLFVACLIPRAWAAWQWNVLWSDTLAYLHASKALEQGDLQGAFGLFGLNTYPVILTGLRHLGFDWQLAGKIWSIMAASAVVLPLWGWLRRQFGDRIACVACLCYAFHGKLVGTSPLIIRDPTFWFFAVATLYFAWRAAVEVRLTWFLAAGAALTLAIHTRAEGRLLVLPLLGWAAGRFMAAAGLAGVRRRLVLGTALCLAVVPLSVATVNLAWLRDNPHWELFRSDHVRRLKDWWESADRSAKTSQGDVGVDRAPTKPRLDGFTRDRKLALRLVKTFTYAGSLLLVLGLCLRPRLFFRRDILPVHLMNLLLIAMVRIYYSTADIDIRYFLPAVIFSTPWMAMGLLQALAWTVHAVDRRAAWTPTRRAALVGALAVAVAAASMAESWLPAVALMRREKLLGLWVLERLGPEKTISGNFSDLSLPVYFSQGRPAETFDLADYADGPLPPAIQSGRADVVLLTEHDVGGPEVVARAVARLEALGYRRARPDQLPPECRSVDVFLSAANR